MNNYGLQMGGRQYAIGLRGLKIGRDRSNQIPLQDPRVSANHAFVWQQDQQLFIRDQGSTNGTFVNGQRVTQTQSLQRGDTIRVGNNTLTVITGVKPKGSQAGELWPWLLMGGLAILFIGVILVVTSNDSTLPAPNSGTLHLTRTATRVQLTPTATPLAPLERARLATVQIVGDAGTGSGSVIDARGYILTNYHVIEGESTLRIAVNDPDQNAPPAVDFQAEALARDEGLDLALLHIVADDRGDPLSKALNLVSLPLGDSDLVKIGDEVVILGFPGVGGETLTLTRGTVSGFHDDGLGNTRGWIKTDAEVSPGNSGGVAINEAGELIGVPTMVSAEGLTLGRLGVLRPINLAKDLYAKIP